jgi:hypothetical protein
MHHIPEDLTVTVPADLTLAELQTALGRARQWLPIDPPDSSITLATILNSNPSGPRRYGYGTVRDYVIGLKVRLPDGNTVKCGGQVVKNVAGYDLQKLFIGSGGTLATPLEVTFKLRPLPERENVVQQSFTTLDSVGTAIDAVVASQLTPVVFDLHRDPADGFTLVLGFDGTREDVDWQRNLAAELGFNTESNLEYDRAFHVNTPPVRKLSVLPSKLIDALRPLGCEPFVARAGNGIIHHRANYSAPAAVLPTQLLRRVKEAFDPRNVLPQPNV